MTDDSRSEAAPSYAMGQLWRALEAARSHPDRAVRQRAEEKAERWRAVLSGMESGELTVGSRTPVADTPAWVTLEVAHGGFATGRYLAEVPLDDQEAELLQSLQASSPGTTSRERLNLWYLSDVGLAKLMDAMSRGTFRVDLPEEGALLVVAWLVTKGQSELVLDLVSQLRPLMHRLRFAPRLDTRPMLSGSLVRLQTAGEVARSLGATRVRPQIQAMRHTLSVWHPLFDRLVELWADTVDGEIPVLVDGAVSGGWPCQVWPSDWSARRTQWLADYASACAQHPRSGRHHDAKSNFSRLCGPLEALDDNRQLSARDVGWVRRALANTITKHGPPGGERRVALRALQAAIAARPTHAQLAHVVAGRLDRYAPDGGIPAVAPVVAGVRPDESAEDGVVGATIPEHVIPKVARALEAPIEELIERNVVSSGEMLARVLPQISSEVIAANIQDRVLAAVYRQTYSAFRRRRSLLLLDLEHQVQLDELPWIGALAPFTTNSDPARRGAAQTLRQATLLALSAFPQTIMPNPLIREMGALASQADVELPLVEEVAADIFMGTFTVKWRRAAALTSDAMAGTLYANYYDLPEPEFWTKRPTERRRWPFARQPGAQTADDFAALCAQRAEEAQNDGAGSFVASNGTVLEQSQILTTHNLAALTADRDVRERIVELSPVLAERTFTWIVRRQAQPWPEYQATLQMIKNIAYAWRQAIFFLSFCEAGDQRRALNSLRELLPRLGPGAGLGIAVDGLDHVVSGGRFTTKGTITGTTGRRFLGWSAGRHWLMPRESTEGAPG